MGAGDDVIDEAVVEGLRRGEPAIAVGVGYWWMLNRTRFGRNIYAIGGNREAAATLRANARPTALGAPLLAEIDRWDRYYEDV